MQKLLALGVLPPAVFVGGALLIGWWRRRGADGPEGPLWLAPLAVLIAYLGVHAALLGGFVLPPRVAADWMPLVGVAGGLLALAAWRWKGPRWALWALRGAVVVGVGLACASSKLRHGLPLDRAALLLGTFLAHTLAVWWVVERLASRERGPAPPAVLTLYALAAGQVVALAYYSLKVAQMPTAVAACTGAAGVVALIRPRLSLARGGLDVPVLITQAALFQGYLYSSGEGGAWYVALLLGVPLAALAPDFLPLRGWRASAARVAAATIVAGAAIGLAIALRPASDY